MDRSIFALRITLIFFISFMMACRPDAKYSTEMTDKTPLHNFMWENANIYFLLTDRFKNGQTENDVNFNRTKETPKYRGFEGGDFRGIIDKIEDGYFTDLGITALWFSPVFEQIYDGTDEGQGFTYAYHGYWIKDWTSLEPNFGTEEELKELVQKAHEKGIKVVMDIILNHTGPVTKKDKVWPSDWVRTGPKCTFEDYETTTECTLVENLPDILTESTDVVDLPASLLEKWRNEGRLESELSSLDDFFSTTGLEKTPRNYIIKWLVDLIHKYGIDGFRVDTAKHVEESAWDELYKEAQKAYKAWREAHPDEATEEENFFMMGEVYGYNLANGKLYDFGDRTVNYYNHGFKSLINFGLKYEAREGNYEEVFNKYSNLLKFDLEGHSVVNYMASHDDGDPYDRHRENPFRAANYLLLTPGASQVYYGDETSRILDFEGGEGDVTLRTSMNWDALENNEEVAGFATQDVLRHYQRLGSFRAEHPAVGAGEHFIMQEKPYYCFRSLSIDDKLDRVVIGLDLPAGQKELNAGEVLGKSGQFYEYYSEQEIELKDGKFSFESPYDIALIGLKKE